ncbi:MAG: hypothetical protein HW416_3060 [Chloroflexi bacterium]|nr:hypothetical protein [Chloroflexota bacterium]
MIEQPNSMIVRCDQPLIGVPVRKDGEDMVRYVADEEELEKSSGKSGVERALALAGAWSDLDADEMLDALDRIRHESKPTPPIDDL